jgi:hypothetical protein
MKTCTHCGVSKDESLFGVNKASPDGLNYKCRQCVSAYQKERRDRLNASRPAGWKQKTKDKAQYAREWKDNHPGYATAKKREWWQKNRDRMHIKDKVKYAVKTGKLIKTPCQVCGELKVEGHHPDYSRPLDVVWLCRKHHNEIHHA